jgi:predicted TIM-barrel fold metal-dependent hydrolase
MTASTAELPHPLVAPFTQLLLAAPAASPVPVLRLFLARVFDRYPNLRLVVANPGALPILLPRIDAMLAAVPPADKPRRCFLDVWQHNLYLTTADALDMASLRALLEQCPIDRVLYASNYPLEERGDELMAELKESGFLSLQEWEKLAWGNAEYLFGLGRSGSLGAQTGHGQTVFR